MSVATFYKSGKKYFNLIYLLILLLISYMLFAISQKENFYLDCNIEKQICIVGEIKNGIKNINREIPYSEIQGYYLYNSPRGYFSVYDKKPQTSFALKIKKDNKEENVIFPFIGRIDWLQADKIYNDIFKQGIVINQNNHFKLFFQILSFLFFLVFCLSVGVFIKSANRKTEYSVSKRTTGLRKSQKSKAKKKSKN